MIAVTTPEIETVPKLNNSIDTLRNSLEEEKEIVKPKKKKKVMSKFKICVCTYLENLLPN